MSGDQSTQFRDCKVAQFSDCYWSETCLTAAPYQAILVQYFPVEIVDEILSYVPRCNECELHREWFLFDDCDSWKNEDFATDVDWESE